MWVRTFMVRTKCGYENFGYENKFGDENFGYEKIMPKTIWARKK